MSTNADRPLAVHADVRPPDLRRSPAPGEARPTTASPRLWFVIGRALGTVVITVHGEFGPRDVARFHDVLEDLIDRQGNLDVAVDLRPLRHLDEACVTVFAVASKWARDRGGHLRLYGPSLAVSRVLHRAGLVTRSMPSLGCSPRERDDRVRGHSAAARRLTAIPTCPRCGAEEFETFSDDDLIVFRCFACRAAWHIELGHLCPFPAPPDPVESATSSGPMPP